MKKYISLFLLLCGVVALSTAQNTIKGKIKGYAGEKVTVAYNKGKYTLTDTVSITKNGSFTYENAEYVPDFMSVAKQRFTLFMRPGSHLEISLDIRDAEKWKAVFKGDYVAENDYRFSMQQFQYLQHKLLSGEYIPFKEFQEQLLDEFSLLAGKLEKVSDKELKAQGTELQNVLPFYIGFEYYNTFRRSQPDKVMADKGFAAFMDGIDLSDRTHADYNVVSQVINWNLDRQGITDAKERSMCYFDMAAKLIKDEQVCNGHLSAHMKWKLMGEKNSELQVLFDKYASVCTDTAQIAANRDRLNVVMNYFEIRNGVQAPDFEMVDTAGHKVRLSDFRGKMVYIDVWATWCAPCKAEIPHVATLHKQFMEDERIEFISISVDTKAKGWKKMVAKDQPTWKQFIVEGGTDSYFYKKYAIEFIPRFMVIDKNGKIVEISYMKPSAPGCADNLRKLLEANS